jgi:hypothetical protein
MAYRPDRGWGFSHPATPAVGSAENIAELESLRRRVTELEIGLKKRDK